MGSMTDSPYTPDDVTVIVPKLSGFRTIGACTDKIEPLSTKQQLERRQRFSSHHRRTVDSWRSLDAETSNDQGESKNLDVRSSRSCAIRPNRNITRRFRRLDPLRGEMQVPSLRCLLRIFVGRSRSCHAHGTHLHPRPHNH